VAGEGVAREASPVAERDGLVTVACRSATWAQELDLLQSDLLERLNAALGEVDLAGTETPVSGLRFTADATRHQS
jgi:predicted nucleic acid-binding Zn ribbon protein